MKISIFLFGENLKATKMGFHPQQKAGAVRVVSKLTIVPGSQRNTTKYQERKESSSRVNISSVNLVSDV